SLRVHLRKEGVYLTTVSAASSRKAGKAGAEAGGRKLFLGRVSTDDLAIMTRQLATLIGAGIPLVESLGALVEQVEHPRLQRIVSQVKSRVNEGTALGDALADHKGVFSDLYINMVRAGESSGTLELVLVRLADFTE